MLSNEAALLPDVVQDAVIEFVEANIAWLQKALAGNNHANDADSKAQATLIYSAFEGAMSVAALMQDKKWLQTVIDSVVDYSGFIKNQPSF